MATTTITEEVEKILLKKDRRVGKGKVISLSRKVYRIINSDIFYVESESKDEMYYYVMFNTAKNFEWCSCFDFDKRQKKCKHIYGVEFAIRDGTVKDTDKLPQQAKKDYQVQNCNSDDKQQYKEDEYSF